MDCRKKLLLAAAVLLLAIAAVGYYFYSSLTFKPKWYSEQETAPAYAVDTEEPEVQAAIDSIKMLLETEGRANIAAEKLTHAMVCQVKSRIDIDAGKMIKAAQWHPSDSVVEMEMVVDLTKMPREKLSPRAASAFDKVMKLTGGAILDNIYIKASLPAQKPGQPVCIDPKSKVHIGKMEFTVEQLEKRAGISARKVLEKLGWFNIRQTDDGFVLMK